MGEMNTWGMCVMAVLTVLLLTHQTVDKIRFSTTSGLRINWQQARNLVSFLLS